jgi:hypothetical protein
MTRRKTEYKREEGT